MALDEVEQIQATTAKPEVIPRYELPTIRELVAMSAFAGTEPESTA